MSKYNTVSTTKTTNLAGGVAYSQSPELEFISILLTSFVKDQFYRSESDTVDKVKELVKQLDPKFVAQCAIYARTKFGMRSISHVVAGEVAKNVHGATWTRSFFDKIVYRPDDMGEILGYYFATEKKLSNPLRDGFARALSRMSEYELAKYKGDGKSFGLVDVANLCHPKHTEALQKLIKGELKPAETWETKLTQAGQNAETEEQKEDLKAEAWKTLVLEKKIGYFALLRNLRNIIEQAPEVLTQALEILVDEYKIKKSLVLPFRFLTASEQIQQLNGNGVRQTMVALSKAIEISLANVPRFDGKTLVVVDSSGSMSGKPAQIASIFATALYKSNDADLMLFSDDARYISPNPTDSLLTIAKSIPFIGGGTNFHSIFQTANRAYDRVVILSDMQGWVGYNSPVREFNDYKTRLGCSPFIYSFDLQGYGTLQLPESKVFCLAGFSDKVFDIMKLLESDKQALVNEIKKVEL